MPTQTLNVETRIKALNAALADKGEQTLVSNALKDASGDWSVALSHLKANLPTASVKRLEFANILADLSDDSAHVVKALTNDPKVTNLRDVALNFNPEGLTRLVAPAATPGTPAHDKAKAAAISLRRKLFTTETTAVLHRMVKDAEIPIADTQVLKGVTHFLDNRPDFNIHTTSIYTALKDPKAFKDIAEEQRAGVVEQLKILQRVQAITPVPEAIPVLMKANLTSAFHVGEMPESTFMNAYGEALGGEEIARTVYTNAINNRIRNEQALMTMRESARGTGLAIMDDHKPMEVRMAMMQKVADEKGIPLNLDALFGSIDYCECDECQSVYSPASYFVELLQYLRNNNLNPKNLNTGKKGYTNTPLEKLFRRRPDLGCLELTCENTFTVLPYIDLVNEVMESFVVHLGEYSASTTKPKQATLEAFNVEDETTGELLAQPQHTNYEAYCILKNAVYPFTLPYHQPIDAIRIFLNYLGTSRYELLDTYRPAHEACPNTTLTSAELQKVQTLHGVVQDRAIDAEFLELAQEEYIILTKEAFWSKHYFDITQQTTHTAQEYRQKIGVKPIHEYYGYDKEADMLSTDESKKLGLSFVKKQFLPRTGIQYTDLVELLKTRFLNPNFPQGEALSMLEGIRFSYRFLQTLVVPGSNPTTRFAKLIDFLEKAQPLLPLWEAMLHPDPCNQHKIDACMETKDFKSWVYCHFDRIGKLIVLESGEGLRLPIEGQLFTEQFSEEGEQPELVGTLRNDGTIINKDGKVIGNVTIDSKALDVNGQPFIERFQEDTWLQVRDPNNEEPIGYIDPRSLLVDSGREMPIRWLPAQDTCNLDKVRLTHLDGTPLTAEEYDGIHRFIRLWRKLGWTIDETDKALTGLALKPTANGSGNGAGGSPSDDGIVGETCEFVDFNAFVDTCETADGGGAGCGSDERPNHDGGCLDPIPADYPISPEFFHQLVAVKKLLDLTGLPLISLLAFWAEISTAGEKSLYSRLFLTHNLLGIDKVFKADANGNYLTQSTKITEHIPMLMAALKLKADDIMAIMDFRKLRDALTLRNVTVLYRHSLLAKILHVSIPELAEAIALFGDPFKSAYRTLDFLTIWGRMEDAGFTFRQLNYLISGHNDPLRPLAPAKKTVLQISKLLYDGLNAIVHDHPDVKVEQKGEATAELVRTKAGLLYEQSEVEHILGLLEGTTVYTTNAPANQTVTIPATLTAKLKYSNQPNAVVPRATLQITGILTDSEKMQAKALSSHPKWAEAIDRAGKQVKNVFNDVLSGIFPDRDDAIKNLFAPDVNLPPDLESPAATSDNTAPAKRFYFLKHFLPFLRRRLAQRLIVDTMSGATGLANDVTAMLLSDILVVGTPPKSAMSALEQIQDKPTASGPGWKGYLIPTADEAYTLVAIGDIQPAPLLIDGQALTFPYQQDDPSNVWSTDPVKLKSGKLYWLEVNDRPADQLEWKTSSSSKAAIPSSALLPEYSSQGMEEVFVKLNKAALLINGFNLSADEISYWQVHGADFKAGEKDLNVNYWHSHGTVVTTDAKDFDFNAITLGHWWRLQAYADLRNNFPRSETTLLELFAWASKPDDPSKLSEKITAVTAWKKENIDKLIKAEHFDLDRPEDFRNEANLVRLTTAVVVADKIGVDIDQLFDWAKPGSKFWVCNQIAESIRKAIRARFGQEDWEQVVKPLNDQLREHQKQALISYLLVQQELIDWGVVDADSLFEFFLIDVQMDACMETSRIKQAISSAQLFIQRCFLGLEEEHDVPNDALDRDRWEWMQRYRVWEANRKVFLYPENWIEPQFRDDKSPFYKELESELLQKDINEQTVEDALKSYLFKVDEVANLKVIGLALEEDIGNDGKRVPFKLHVFGRTRNSPYFFYYRYFHLQEKNWYPWEKILVDIPSYDKEGKEGQVVNSGAYLIPVVWERRMLIFFPQIIKKMRPDEMPAEIDPNAKIPIKKPIDSWEIKMGWSEYRNGKWMQKQVSSEAIYHDSVTPGALLPDIDLYKFVPSHVAGSNAKIVIDVYRDNGGDGTALGAFHFFGSQLQKEKASSADLQTFGTNFHYTSAAGLDTPRIHSLEATTKFDKKPYFVDQKTKVTAHIESRPLTFSHTFVHKLLGKLIATDLNGLFAFYLAHYQALGASDKADVYGGGTTTNGTVLFHELKRAYSLYNWEAGFHATMLCVDRLLKSQQFEPALKMCHYVFNPLAKGSDNKRFWQFPPFRETDATNVLEKLFLGLQPNQPNDDINEWRDKPFEPHVVARSRPSAYMKWVVMKYIEILIAWGDYLFRQDTIETINQATQVYVLAAHIYGPRGQKIPKRGKVKPQTYFSLLDKWDAFSSAMAEMELAFPFSNQTPFPTGISNGVVGLANVFGFATTLYFCIPDNPKLRALRDTIDDRLFKIRHCQNIEGVFRKLPLFEPPIEPGLLVQAAAQGLSLASVLNDLNSPMPNYRFYYLSQKALELCSEIKSLGNAFLSAKEKGDSETIAKLRAKHEGSIHNLVMEVKKQQLEESRKSLEALQQSRLGPESRMQYFLKLIGEDLGKVPNANSDFEELLNQIEGPVDEGGLRLTEYEKEEIGKAAEANDKQEDIGRVEALVNILHVIPGFSAKFSPVGVGPSISFGGSNLGSAAQAMARANQVVVGNRSFSSANAGRKANFLRQLQDRVQQVNNAGYEIKNIDKQILTQQIRVNIANQEITNQQKLIDNSKEIEEFLSSKYTNQELYSWMEGQIRTLYYQAYTLAYELAKKAEKVFRFERGLTTSNFIQFGYWDAAYDGLLAGERLYIGLKQLEAAYQEKRGYDFEVSKTISLRQTNPLALIQLKETGTCEFGLPEVLFDMDYPGHYMRRIKTVALTIPCVVGPYTTVNCTLRLLEHKFRKSAIAKDKNDYLEKMDEIDDRFSTINVPITSIAASTGQNDSGVFELNFRDERYIPFEGAGTVSKWQCELPKDFRQFEYDTISDVIMQLRYTALDGGYKLKSAAGDSVQGYIKSVEGLSQREGLFAAFDLRHDFPDEWYKAMNPPAGATERILTLRNLHERLPVFTKGRPPAKIELVDAYLFTSASLKSSDLVLSQSADINFTDAPALGTMKSFSLRDIGQPMSDWQVKIKDTKAEIEKFWLLARYVLK